MYKFGTIVLIPFPFTDLTSRKLRPVLIVSQTNTTTEDIIVTFMSSKIPKTLSKSHFLLKTTDPHFAQMGLKIDSILRFDKIATLSKKLVLGEIGTVPKLLLQKMKKHFLAAFGF